jgi:hypothetical protein
VTLDSRIYVHDEIQAADVFRTMQANLAKYDDRPDAPAQTWTVDQDGYPKNGNNNPWTIANDCGQGLPAWLMVHYRPGAALRPDAEACSQHCDTDPEDPEPYHSHGPAHWLVVSIDTSYGYRDAAGRGCGDLHALLIAELGQWLDARGVAWSWENEFTSEIHGGEDRYRRLVDLASSGFEASAWFRTTVLPAISGVIASGELPGGAS